jgi:ribosomal protein S18 acetylase RimI-like enzyme
VITPRVAAVGPEHAGELLTVQRAAYVTEAQLYSAPDIPPLVEPLSAIVADIAAPDVLVFGAWLGGRLVGSVRGRLAGELMEVARFAVAPDMQGRGIGRALLGALEAAVPAEVRTLWLGTGPVSAGNLRLYRNAGYELIGRRTDSAGVELVVLAKSIN